MSTKEYISKIDAMKINNQKIQWKCSCSMDKMKQLLNVISEEEQEEILVQEGKIEIKCNYCNEKYILKKVS